VGHDGQNAAFKARAVYDRENDKAATVCYVEQHASLLIAYSLSKGLSPESGDQSNSVCGQPQIYLQSAQNSGIFDGAKSIKFVCAPSEIEYLSYFTKQLKTSGRGVGEISLIDKTKPQQTPVQNVNSESKQAESENKSKLNVPSTKTLDDLALRNRVEPAANQIKDNLKSAVRQPDKSHIQKLADLNLTSPRGFREI